MSIGEQVSNSIKEQNKYLYNYIHKLEFLVLNSQQESENTDFKFKRIIDHIAHLLPTKIEDPREVIRALRSIEMMNDHYDQDSAQKDATTSDPVDKDFLLEALGADYKSINNIELGFVPNSNGQPRHIFGELDSTQQAHKKLDLARSVKCATELTVEEIRELTQPRSINGNYKRTKERFTILKSAKSYTSNPNTKEGQIIKGKDNDRNIEYMSQRSQELRRLLKQGFKKKRDSKRKRKLQEHRDAQIYKMPDSKEFNNDAFDSLKISKKNGSRIENGADQESPVVSTSNDYKIRLHSHELGSSQLPCSLPRQYNDPREEVYANIINN